jgi:RNA polymerase sigma factor (sigma-70 family)
VTLPLELMARERTPPPDRQLETLLERRGVRAELWRALQTLPARLREPVALRYLGELRYKEIGQALGCNPKTAESRVRQGVAGLRAALQGSVGEAEVELAEQWGW